MSTIFGSPYIFTSDKNMNKLELCQYYGKKIEQ